MGCSWFVAADVVLCQNYHHPVRIVNHHMWLHHRFLVGFRQTGEIIFIHGMIGEWWVRICDLGKLAHV